MAKDMNSYLSYETKEGEYSFIQTTWRRFKKHKLALIGSAVIVFILFFCLVGPYISPYSPEKTNLDNIFAKPSLTHPFGTDELGRDVMTRAMYGGRISLMVAFLGGILAHFVGTAMGMISGYFGGRVDDILMRLAEVVMSVPTLPFMLVMAVYLGPGMLPIVIVTSVFGWAGTARIVRGQILQVKTNEYIEAAQAVGVGHLRMMGIHLLPNILHVIIVGLTLRLGGVILWESTLSYLGLGIQPPTPSWGNMLQRSMEYVTMVFGGTLPWWLTFYPGFFIFTTVLAFSFVGDGLRDALDPRLKL